MNTPANPSKDTTRDVKSDLFIRSLQPKRCDVSQFIYFCKTLYMFQTVFPSIVRSSKLHIQYCYLLLAAGSSNGLANTERCMCGFAPSFGEDRAHNYRLFMLIRSFLELN